MEWHVVKTILACFLAIFGFSLDLQSFVGGVHFIREGAGPRGFLLWPLLFYVAAALTCDGNQTFKVSAIAAGLLLHLLSTIGLRLIGKVLNRQ